MEFHEVANIFPMMQADEFAALVDDIQRNGQLEPIWIHDGQIIDGRNRYNACVELGKIPITREWTGGGSLVEFVVSLNLHRRHLTTSQAGMVSLSVEELLAVEAKERQARKPVDSVRANLPEQKTERPRETAAKMTGVSPRTVQNAKKIAKESPALAEQVMSGELTIHKAMKKIKADKKAERKAEKAERKAYEPQKTNLLDLCEFHHCGVADLHKFVEPNSIDHIITDPPYPKEFLPVYYDLGKFAAYALKDGGSLIAMVGQSYLMDIMQMFAAHLNYQWAVAYTTPGGQAAQMWDRKVNTFWKPVLWFVKGEYTGDWIGDVAKSAVNNNDKSHHYWGQSESGMADLIERFTYPEQTICDPFIGGGTTAYVGAEMNRRVIGCDIDKGCIDGTIERLGNG